MFLSLKMRSVSANDDSSKKLINSSHSSLQLLPPKATDSIRPTFNTFFLLFPLQVCYPATCSIPSWTGTETHTTPPLAPSLMRKHSTLPRQVIQVIIIHLFNELNGQRHLANMMMALALVAWFNPVLKLSRKFVNMFPKHEVFMCNFWLKSC